MKLLINIKAKGKYKPGTMGDFSFNDFLSMKLKIDLDEMYTKIKINNIVGDCIPVMSYYTECHLGVLVKGEYKDEYYTGWELEYNIDNSVIGYDNERVLGFEINIKDDYDYVSITSMRAEF